MSAKKVTKRIRYPKSSISMGKIILLINNPIFKWKFMRPGTEKRNISEENVDDLILASNEEIILNPHIYTRLTAIDFYVILMWVRQGKKILDQFKNQVFYFSTSSLVNAEKVKVRQMKKRPHYICMEKDLNRDTWIYHIRDIAWIKRPHGHKIICLKNIK